MDITYRAESVTPAYCSQHFQHLQFDRPYTLNQQGIYMFASVIIWKCEDVQCWEVTGSKGKKAGPIKTSPRRTTSTTEHLRQNKWNRYQPEYEDIFSAPFHAVQKTHFEATFLQLRSSCILRHFVLPGTGSFVNGFCLYSLLCLITVSQLVMESPACKRICNWQRASIILPLFRNQKFVVTNSNVISPNHDLCTTPQNGRLKEANQY